MENKIDEIVHFKNQLERIIIMLEEYKVEQEKCHYVPIGELKARFLLLRKDSVRLEKILREV